MRQAMTGSTSKNRRRKRLNLRAAPEYVVELRANRSLREVAEGVRKLIGDTARERSDWPLFFFGPPGRGKTYAALSLLDRCYHPYKYYTTASLRQLLIDAQQGRETPDYPFGISPAEVWRSIESSNIVVLDEIGVDQNVSDYHSEAVCGVLDRRDGLPLVVISNLTPSQIATVYDDRIHSRMCCGTLVDFGAYPDRRLAAQELA